MRPDGASQSQQEEEYRLSVALLPLRLRIDQSMVTFLQSFFATSDTAAKEASADASAGTAVTDTVQESEGTVFHSFLFSGQLENSSPFGVTVSKVVVLVLHKVCDPSNQPCVAYLHCMQQGHEGSALWSIVDSAANERSM